MLDGVTVAAYGTTMPLNQVANVIVADSQMLQVTPFDPANLQAIAAAVRNDPSLGLNPSDDGRVVRVAIPPLTGERRAQIAKQLGDKAEECRIALRNVRQEAFKSVKAKKEAKELSEDDAKRAEKEIDKLMADFSHRVESAAQAKEREVMTV